MVLYLFCIYSFCTRVHSKENATTSRWHLVWFDLDANCILNSRLNSVFVLGDFRVLAQQCSIQNISRWPTCQIHFEHRFRKSIQFCAGHWKSQADCMSDRGENQSARKFQHGWTWSFSRVHLKGLIAWCVRMRYRATLNRMASCRELNSVHGIGTATPA